MSRSVSIAVLARGINRQKVARSLYPLLHHSTVVQSGNANVREPREDKYESRTTFESSRMDTRALSKYQTGGRNARQEKVLTLVRTLVEAKDCKETIYASLDAWVAFDQKFPIVPLKNVLISLENQGQWHKVIQVIKWMLSKGQGNTMGTYGQLINALDKEHRTKEAHEIWMSKVCYNLHSVSWKLLSLMISVYYRNNMLEEIVKLFKGLESFSRKPTEKSVVEKVADAYEKLGLPDEKERVMEKYKDLFNKSLNEKKHVTEKDLSRFNNPRDLSQEGKAKVVKT